ncbi:SET domain-containing protein [Tothia fuscella]|uniref:SET domain-containing protein n=1 Tax=Tothia fuscella TaxID=1048955 RepID=A0A9P4NJG6_9PEZI|nr:SET domain-containing protein [Tothia fuscella]
MDNSDHPYQRLQVPKDAPVILKATSRKGWGAFASRAIKKGALIMKEQPLFTIHKHQDDIKDRDVLAALQRLTPTEKEQFLCLRDKGITLFRFVNQAFAENSFALSTDPPIHGAFLIHSRINHSCIPNAKIPEPGDNAVSSFAVRDIAKGEEITFCYNTDFQCRTRADRHRELRFVCECKACQLGTPFQKASDMRRLLIRGSQYLTLGVDLKGEKSAIIIDRNLRRVAENLLISLSTRLIYLLLGMALLEEEGLMDHFQEERMSPGILQIAGMFATESNMKIAILAVAQETWLEKFCIATKLYGQADRADREVSAALRSMHGLTV